MEARLLGVVLARNHSRGHPGVEVLLGRGNERHMDARKLLCGERLQHEQVRMATPGKNQPWRSAQDAASGLSNDGCCGHPKRPREARHSNTSNALPVRLPMRMARRMTSIAAAVSGP